MSIREQHGDMESAFDAAFAAADTEGDSPSPDPVDTPEPEAASEAEPAAAIAQPEGETAETPDTASTETAPEAATPEGDSAPVGEPPKERWADILKNQREKAAQEAREALEAEYGELKGISADDRRVLAQLHQELQRDPVGAVTRQVQALMNDPQYAGALKSQAARTLATKAKTPETAEEPEPQPDLQNKADGTLVYSAPQLQKWSAWRERQLLQKVTAEMEQRFAPVNQVVQSHQRDQAYASVAETIREFEAREPEFATHRADVKAEIQGDQRLLALADTDPAFAIETAWARVYRAKVLPAQLKAKEGEVLANLQQKATAGSTNPSTATATTPEKFTQNEDGFAAALERMAG